VNVATGVAARGAGRAGVVAALLPLLGMALVVVGLATAWALWWRAPGGVVLYCAHDAVFAQGVLARFTAKTGIPVSVRWDSEATKSLGLVERLLSERARPQCDVFWNNELLGTLDLAAKDALEPYRGMGWERIPPAFRDPDARWAGFAARLRVMLVNTAAMKADDAAIAARLAGDCSRVAIAKPLYGTTLTHYSVLWSRLGADGLKAWHRGLRARGAREVDGNAMVKELVASGACDLGFTDTDDAFEALDAGKPVAFTPTRLDDGATIVMPNTVSLIRGAPHQDQARELIDFLLSEETELALANSGSRQVPLGPVDEARLPAEVRALREPASHGIPLAGLLGARNDCLAWLKSEYAP
jgi:iron(III) transport system substrate-binding protein